MLFLIFCRATDTNPQLQSTARLLNGPKPVVDRGLTAPPGGADRVSLLKAAVHCHLSVAAGQLFPVTARCSSAADQMATAVDPEGGCKGSLGACPRYRAKGCGFLAGLLCPHGRCWCASSHTHLNPVLTPALVSKRPVDANEVRGNRSVAIPAGHTFSWVLWPFNATRLCSSLSSGTIVDVADIHQLCLTEHQEDCEPSYEHHDDIEINTSAHLPRAVSLWRDYMCEVQAVTPR